MFKFSIDKKKNKDLIEFKVHFIHRKQVPVHHTVLILHYEGDGLVIRSNMMNEPVHEISNNVVCATSKSSDQPVHMRSLIRAFASRSSIL